MENKAVRVAMLGLFAFAFAFAAAATPPLEAGVCIEDPCQDCSWCWQDGKKYCTGSSVITPCIPNTCWPAGGCDPDP